MDTLLEKSTSLVSKAEICISGSKSESNRYLILQAIFPGITLHNVSDSDDSLILQQALEQIPFEKQIYCNHAGTTMRFLTAFLASKEGQSWELTGSSQLLKRPIGQLVNALVELGASITYLGEEGYPPLKIEGRKLTSRKCSLNASVSSQFVTALMLMACSLKEEFQIQLKGNITSKPYLKLTQNCIQNIGGQCEITKELIKIIPPIKEPKLEVFVESDWSSISYLFSIVALATSPIEIQINSFRKDSTQGDIKVIEYFKDLGVESKFDSQQNSIILKKSKNKIKSHIELNLNDTPDVAQTLVVACAGLGVSCYFKGLHTLVIKETNRLVALKNELEKIGCEVSISNDSLKMQPPNKLNENIQISTYEDHRMAMAFAPLATKIAISIENLNVVRKSFSNYWEVLKKLGFLIEFK